MALVVEAKDQRLRLDKTIFAPRSMEYGHPQAEDMGFFYTNHEQKGLAGGRIGDDGILHSVDGDLPDLWEIAQTTLYWERRHRLMRVHTAAHLLIQVLAGDRGIPVQFHKARSPSVRVDGGQLYVARDRFPRRDWPSVEAAVAARVEEDLPVRAFTLPRADATELVDPRFGDVGRVDPRHEDIRLIKIRGGPAIPCDGTLVRRTGEVGPFRLRGARRLEAARVLDFTLD